MLSATGGNTAFYASYPIGYAPAPSSTPAKAAGTADIVDIRVPLPSGGLTVKAGDSLSVRDLFGSPSADLMRVALRGEGGGRLMLRGTDVTDRTDFMPMDFNELQFVAGSEGSTQELVAVARSGTRDAAGGWTKVADSDPVQIVATVTGSRSLSALPALRTAVADGADAGYVRLAQDASVYAASANRAAPSLSTVGNIALKAGDAVALHDLFGTSGKTAAALYRVALRRDEDRPGGTLRLNGEDVTRRTDFTPEEFVNLQFVAGPAGSSDDLLVVARAGTRDADGRWTNVVDSPATAITAAVAGARSANAAAALRTAIDPSDGDARTMRLAQDAAIFAPLGGGTAPGLASAGDITVRAGDSLSLRDLFPASGKVEPALYRVALRDDPDGPSGGRLLLNGRDVTERTDFSPLEFQSLQYAAGPEGGAQDLLVVARSGKEAVGGGLTAIVDSAPAVLRAGVTGTRSLNTAEALRTAIDPAAADADFMRVASEAAVHVPLGGRAAAALSTVGNFTTAAGDGYALRDLFAVSAGSKVAVSGYRVALRDPDSTSGARLMLDGSDVTRRIDFTPDEYNALRFVAGREGGAQDLLVVARSTGADGLTVDSRAVQVTASVTGERSINAAPALRGMTGDAYSRIAQDAATYGPFGSQKAASLRGVGDFTAAAGDLFAMNTLFDTAGETFEAGTTYRVAMRDDGAGRAGGRLLLAGTDVSDRTDFTGAEFGALLFEAGPAGSARDLLVVARRTDPATRLVTDSPATEITARTTGTRSINALTALRDDGISTAGFDRIVRDAAVYEGPSSPKLASVLPPLAPSLPAQVLAGAVGAYRATGTAAGTPLDLSVLSGAAIGAARSAGSASAKLVQLSNLVALLGGGTVGGVRTTGTDVTKLSAMTLKV